jgi:hypothetical protein
MPSNQLALSALVFHPVAAISSRATPTNLQYEIERFTLFGERGMRFWGRHRESRTASKS